VKAISADVIAFSKLPRLIQLAKGSAEMGVILENVVFPKTINREGYICPSDFDKLKLLTKCSIAQQRQLRAEVFEEELHNKNEKVFIPLRQSNRRDTKVTIELPQCDFASKRAEEARRLMRRKLI
jgi:hypothetical protein